MSELYSPVLGGTRLRTSRFARGWARKVGLGFAVAALALLATQPAWAGPGSRAAVDLISLEAPHLKSGVAYSRISATVVEGRFVKVNLAAVEAGAPRLRIALPDGSTVEARLSDLERRGPSDLTWRGWLEAPEEGRVVLTLREGGLTGTLFARSGRFVVRHWGDGAHGLERLDLSLLPPCGGAQLPAEELVPAATGHGAGAGDLPAKLDPAELDELAEAGTEKALIGIDLLGLYTPLSLSTGASPQAIAGWLQSAVDVNNTAFIDSQVNVRFRLVHVGRIDDITDRGAGGQVSLAEVRASPQMQALRNQYGADLVGVVAFNTGSACGYAFPMRTVSPGFAPNAVQASNIQCIVGTMVWAHEHGHNMGLEHDPANGVSPSSRASFPWSYGHFVDGSYRTIMSYSNQCSNGCPAAPHFSNPNVTHNGVPTGIAGSRHNSRTLNQVAALTAAFRDTAPPPNPGPLPPAELQVVRQKLEMLLSWRDASQNEQGMRVYRGVDGGSLARVADLPADSAEWTDPDLEPDRTYRYQVSAFNAQGERRGSVVEVVVPPLIPVTVRLDQETAVTTGELATFEATYTGPVEETYWRFGGNGLSPSASECGEGALCAQYLYFQPGEVSVEVEVVGELGQTATDVVTFTVGGTSVELAEGTSAVQSVLFGPRGNTGTYESDCWVHNAGASAALVDVAYLVRGQGNPAPDRYRMALGPSQTLTVPNVVSTLFERESSQGGLMLEAYAAASDGAPTVFGFCRSFVRPADREGTFGQLVDEAPEPRWTGQDQVVTGIEVGTGFTTTLLAMSLEDLPVGVEVRLFDAAGQRVGGVRTLQLGRRGIRQRPVVSMFPEAAGATGPFSARFRAGGTRFAASATLLETGSEDQIFVAAKPAEGDTGGSYTVPRVATGANPFGASLVSRLSVTNPGAVPLTLEGELWLRGANNLTPQTASFTVPAGHTVAYTDVLNQLFGLDEGIGALRLSWDPALAISPRIASFALNNSGEGGNRFGTMVDSQDASAAGHRTVIFGAEQSARFRSALGIVNFASAGTRVEVTVRDASGQTLASRQLVLKARQHFERNLEGLFGDTSLGDGAGWSVETRVLSGGPISTYLASFNVSGDLFFVPGRSF